jgi:hypothetical protein
MSRGMVRWCVGRGVAMAFVVSAVAGAQTPTKEATSFERLQPLDQYLMADQAAEIALARSAAPDTISHSAEILVLGHHGYRSAVKGTNGFVCIVERSWMSPFDDPMFLNPAQRLPLCLNPPAARTHLPLTLKLTALAFAGLSKAQMFDSITVAYKTHALPLPEAGSMCYMLSKQQYFGSEHGHAEPHLMFWFPQSVAMQWGAGEDGPVYVHQNSPDPITTFVISVGKWSDGTAAPAE